MGSDREQTATERMFPSLGIGPRIPWRVIAQHEKQAGANHGQTLQCLAERGGLSWAEMMTAADGRNLRAAFKDFPKPADARRGVLQRLALWQSKVEVK